MSFIKALFTLFFLALLQGVNSSLDVGSNSKIAVYWGQGGSDTSLAQFCENFDVVILSFVTKLSSIIGFPSMETGTRKCNPFPGTNLFDCPLLGREIKTCQGQAKTILLSIGGATYTEGGFSSESDAINSANIVWQIFGPSTPESQHRPFGDAVIDGFDFDLESPATNMPSFGNCLCELMNSQPDRVYYLTAAP